MSKHGVISIKPPAGAVGVAGMVAAYAGAATISTATHAAAAIILLIIFFIKKSPLILFIKTIIYYFIKKVYNPTN